MAITNAETSKPKAEPLTQSDVKAVTKGAEVALRAANPNAGIRDAYAKKLKDFVHRMADDIAAAIKEAYSDTPPVILQDAKPETPAERLARRMDEIMGKWQRQSVGDAEMIANWFARRMRASMLNQKRGARADFAGAGKPAALSAGAKNIAVNFQLGKVSADVYSAIVAENVDLIKSIPSRYFADVRQIVMRNVSAGRDLKTLALELNDRYNVTTRRAMVIARDQSNKAFEALSRAADFDSGVRYGIWIHVPGRLTVRDSHVKMHGKRFDLKKGLYDSEVGRYVLPGELILCNCTYRPIFDLNRKA